MFITVCCSLTTVEASSFRVGDQGSEVAEIQGQLASLGYDVSADGDFGPATAEAVKAFQASRGLTADGAVGEATYRALLGKAMPEVSRGNNYISRRVTTTALQYIGVPYVFGGSSPAGFDCSGYVRYVFASAGVYLPRAADEQYEVGTPIPTGELMPGDLVFFSTYTYGASHVGIYLGDGKFINASSSRGVAVDSLHDGYWGSCYIGARRVM
ncbi:MAG: C40 family peptidase [Selenomonadaceae bacterium]|nr:C40 family peptidase [Selenomonadaceae bacterium]